MEINTGLKYCHNEQRDERREPVKLQMSTSRHMRKMLEGNQRFRLILRLRDNRDWCKLSKAALGRVGKVGLTRTKSQRSEN